MQGGGRRASASLRLGLPGYRGRGGHPARCAAGSADPSGRRRPRTLEGALGRLLPPAAPPPGGGRVRGGRCSRGTAAASGVQFPLPRSAGGSKTGPSAAACLPSPPRRPGGLPTLPSRTWRLCSCEPLAVLLSLPPPLLPPPSPPPPRGAFNGSDLRRPSATAPAPAAARRAGGSPRRPSPAHGKGGTANNGAGRERRRVAPAPPGTAAGAAGRAVGPARGAAGAGGSRQLRAPPPAPPPPLRAVTARRTPRSAPRNPITAGNPRAGSAQSGARTARPSPRPRATVAGCSPGGGEGGSAAPCLLFRPGLGPGPRCRRRGGSPGGAGRSCRGSPGKGLARPAAGGEVPLRGACEGSASLPPRFGAARRGRDGLPLAPGQSHHPGFPEWLQRLQPPGSSSLPHTPGCAAWETPHLCHHLARVQAGEFADSKPNVSFFSLCSASESREPLGKV